MCRFGWNTVVACYYNVRIRRVEKMEGQESGRWKIKINYREKSNYSFASRNSYDKEPILGVLILSHFEWFMALIRWSKRYYHNTRLYHNYDKWVLPESYLYTEINNSFQHKISINWWVCYFYIFIYMMCSKKMFNTNTFVVWTLKLYNN